MNIPLPEELERFVRDQVRAGRFQNEEDVVRDALERALVQDSAMAPRSGGELGSIAPMREQARQRRDPAPDDANGPDDEPITTEKPLWEAITEIARRIPDEEWAKIPADASYQLDHHVYGSPKKPVP